MSKSHAERLAQFNSAGLYLVSSASVSAGRPTLDILHAALDAGVTLIQLREKDLAPRTYFALAEKARLLTHRYGALLILNDRLDTVSRCAKEAIRREVELLRKLRLPIYVAENGRVIDVNAPPLIQP